jgi:hypothetical protein
MPTPHRWPADLFLLVAVAFGGSFKFQSEPFSQDNQPPGNRGRARLLLNNPFFAAVRALPQVDSGKAVLKVRNYSHETVVVENLFMLDEGEFRSEPLLEAPLRLRPADTEWLDVTPILVSLFRGQVKEKRTKVVQIEIRLFSEADAFSLCRYIVGYGDGSIMQFSFEETKGRARDSRTDSACSS